MRMGTQASYSSSLPGPLLGCCPQTLRNGPKTPAFASSCISHPSEVLIFFTLFLFVLKPLKSTPSYTHPKTVLSLTLRGSELDLRHIVPIHLFLQSNQKPREAHMDNAVFTLQTLDPNSSPQNQSEVGLSRKMYILGYLNKLKQKQKPTNTQFLLFLIFLSKPAGNPAATMG